MPPRPIRGGIFLACKTKLLKKLPQYKFTKIGIHMMLRIIQTM